ncbi:MAG: UDP-N-acetylglucosamine 1-carboxyvinyltransferase [Ruminococcus sp.]|nr:UDP-N-acetylglucosamine 1-carboxyvinyltransferase [Ruminococcus sp.]MDE6678351.1 UDP-N-acetylglucosamine 1-carboxyvinyltransferase [Ruminococcus sp.]
MDKFIIKGGRRLSGEVVISGAKNAVVAILPAVILSDEPCVIENVPDISDVRISIKILREMGAEVTYLGNYTYRIDPTTISRFCVPYEIARKMRASYYFLGALLGKYNKARVSMPGGCPLGDRPIDQHLKAFSILGADYTLSQGMIDLKAEKLTGNQIFFDVVTVGATMNAMLAAVKAEGLTVIENAAKEPHIVDLANFLNSMGANIMGAGTDVIKIRGVKRLHGANYSVIPDQIEAGTFMIAAAATNGDVTIKNVIPKHLESITKKLEKIGVNVECYDDSVRVWTDGPLVKTNVKTSPHPGFPTDMQPQIATLLTLASGTSIITESIWEQRFRYVDELRRMGADITVNGSVALIEGTGRLTGAPVKACDLRAGAALIIAGLSASGITEIEDIFHIERGYDSMDVKLRSIGADIKKVSEPEELSETEVQSAVNRNEVVENATAV